MSEAPIETLLIEDSQTDASRLQEILGTCQISLVPVRDLAEALNQLRENPFDLLLLTLSHPDEQGLDILRKARSAAPEVPVIALAETENQGIEALREGAQDYIVKTSTNRDSLMRSIRCAVERSRLQTALRESEERYRCVAENVSELICRHSPEGNFLDVSPACRTLLGYEPAELLGRSAAEFFHPDDTPDTGIKATRRIRHRHGHYIALETASRAVRNPHTGKVREIVTVFRTPSSRVPVGKAWCEPKNCAQTQKAKQQSEAFYKSLADALPQYLYRTDLNGRITFANRALLATWGVTLQEATGKTACDFYPQELAEISRAGDIQVIRNGESFEAIEKGHNPENGRTVYLQVVKVPVRDAGGKTVGVQGIFWDISDTVRAEREKSRLIASLQKTEARFAETQRVAHAGCWEFDIASGEIYWSEEIFRICGLEPAQKAPSYQEYLQIVHPEDRQVLQSALQLAITAGAPYEFDQRILRPDGSVRCIATKGQPVFNADGQVVKIFGTSLDITERKAAETALRQSEELYRTLTKNFPNGAVILFDANLRHILADGTGLAELGLSKERLEGKTLGECFPPQVCRLIAPVYRKALAGNPTVFEKECAEKIYQVRAVPVFDDCGQITAGLVMTQNITELKQALAALRESEEKFRAIFEQAAVGISLLSPTGQFLSANRGFCHTVGYAPEELPALNFQDITHPEDLSANLDCHKQILANQIQNVSFEKRYLRKDGSPVWVSASIAAVRDISGEAKYLIAVVGDISERKQAQEALRSSQQQLNAILDNAPAVIYTKDTGGRFLLINRQFETLFGVSREEVQGKKDWEVFPRQIADKFRANDLAVLAASAPAQWEEVAPQNDGLHTYISTKFPLCDATGTPYAVGGISIDITQRLRAEAERDRFFTLSLDLFCIADFTGYLKRLNPAWQTHLGYTEEQLLSRPFIEFVHPDDREATLAEIRKLNAGVPTVLLDNRFQRTDGSYRWFSWTAAPFVEEGLIYAVGRDITESKQAEESLRASQRFVQQIAESSPHILYIYDIIEQRNVYANREVAEILGYTPQEIKNMGSALFPTIIHPDNLVQLPKHFQKLNTAKDGEILELEYRMRNAAGEWIWLHSRETVFARSPDGRVQQILGTAAEITESKQAAETLAERARQSALRYDIGTALTQGGDLPEMLRRCGEALVDHLDAAFARIWTLSPDGSVLELQASAGISAHTGGAQAKIPAGTIKIDLIAANRTPYLTNDLQNDPRASTWDWARREGMVAFAGYPLVVEGRLAGVMAIFAKHPLSENTCDFLGSVADQVALGIERKRAAEALLKSEERLQMAIEGSALGLWDWNISTGATYFDPQWKKMLGYEEGEIENSYQSFERLIHLQDLPKVMQMLSDCLEGRSGVFEAEFRMKSKAGEWKWLLSHGKVFERDELGLPVRMTGTHKDITQRRQVEETLRLQIKRERLALAMQERIRSSLNLDEILTAAVGEVRQFLQTDRTVIYRFNPDWSGAVTVESVGEGWLSTLGVDIQDRCFAGTYVPLYQKGRFRAIDDIYSAGLNECHLELLSRLQVKANLVVPILKSSSESGDSAPNPKSQTQNRLWGLLIAHQCSGARHWRSYEIESLRQLAVQLAIAIGQSTLFQQAQTEIAERRLAEEALRKSEAREREKATQLEAALRDLRSTQTQLIQNEKMVALGQMVAGVAHEINNPTSFIYGNVKYATDYTSDLLRLVDLYRKYYPEPAPEIQEELGAIDLEFLKADFLKLLNSMKEGANRIREIVLSLRNFSRLDEAEMKAVDIHTGIDSTLLILQHRLKATSKRPEIRVLKEYTQLPEVECYAGQLNQVFMNILANAIDALEEGHQTHSQQPAILIRTELLDGERAAVRISDSGPGIPDAIKMRIFDPFFTTKPIGSGTGLGLSISFQIVVDKHKGNLACFSAPGEGTEFVIELPVRHLK
ncbi:PAS domain S-box protein [Kamptonema formosum]|uniref:PAS domain S-box protein n=1 Tax=Kamptonema formosum TaxID=331992 RepID=UPI0003475296|nr:PAS domain S-box protein [Oscillatoria sp. PCC 10802]